MSIETHESNQDESYATAFGDVVSRTVDRVVVRGDTPPDGGYGNVDMTGEDIARQSVAGDQSEGADVAPAKPRIDLDFHTNSIAVSPDAAAIGFAATQDANRGKLGFRLEYSAD